MRHNRFMRKYKLFVHSTLKKGRINHWMLFGCRFEGNQTIHSQDGEIYSISFIRLVYLIIFEALCGWHLVFNKLNKVFIFYKNA